MDTEKKEQGATPPYVAFKTLKNFTRGLKAAIPSRIDKSVMPSLSGGAQSQILSALKYLKLTNAAGVPENLLVRLVQSDGAENAACWLEALSAYPFVANKHIDLETATMHQLEEEFAKLASGDTVRKCVVFFIPAAKEAGIKLSPFFKEPGKRSPSNGKPKKPRVTVKDANAQQHQPRTNAQGEQSQHQPQVLAWHELLLAKFPSFDPNWPDDVKTKWFTSFSELMEKGKKPV